MEQPNPAPIKPAVSMADVEKLDIGFACLVGMAEFIIVTCSSPATHLAWR